MNVRELCRVLATALHVPGVERYAARLVRRGLLPRSGCEVGTLDAAVLLAAVVAAPRPEDASRVVVTLAHLPLVFVERRVGSAESSTWVPGNLRLQNEIVVHRAPPRFSASVGATGAGVDIGTPRSGGKNE